MSGAEITFAIVAIMMVFSAWRVVVSDALVRAVLWLGAVLIVTAALYITLGSPFLAGIQLLLYTGGVITLMLFGVMMTRRHEGLDVPNPSHRKAGAMFFSAALFAAMTAAILATDFDGLGRGGSDAASAVSTAALGKNFLNDHLIAFELLSILLLAVMVAAITLGRKKDFGDEEGAR